jgi:hypothetical protein
MTVSCRGESNEPSRVHDLAGRRGGRLAARGARAATRADAAHRRPRAFACGRCGRERPADGFHTGPQRRPDLPRHMAGGPDNPMGARAIYLGASLYRIHGSNEPDKIGQAVSSGCIRLTNQDVIDLYNRVQIGATVIVQ